RRRGDRVCGRRDPHSGACLAAAAEPAARRPAHGRRDVHHQLFMRRGRAGGERPRLGRHRRAGGGIHSHRHWRRPHHRPRPDPAAGPPRRRPGYDGAMMGYGRGVVGSILSYNSHSFQPKDQPVTETASRITAESFLSRLAERGVEYVMANAGTDFAPIIEALSRNPGTNRKYPRVITVPHENVAVSMAHGYYRVSGKPAVVMVHVTVGTANAICGIMNASRDNAPILLCAGRTPVTETGHQASRNRSIHWGQEMFDQGGLTREFVKWDLELRAGQPADSVVDRALDIAMSEPRGPVYLTLPREVLADPAVASRRDSIRP